ncbi:MAG: hypothetical protein ACT4PL_12795, partial [Phycisphaerales bacterium]
MQAERSAADDPQGLAPVARPDRPLEVRRQRVAQGVPLDGRQGAVMRAAPSPERRAPARGAARRARAARRPAAP